jgi:hypothetical protein
VHFGEVHFNAWVLRCVVCYCISLQSSDATVVSPTWEYQIKSSSFCAREYQNTYRGIKVRIYQSPDFDISKFGYRYRNKTSILCILCMRRVQRAH